MDNLIGLDKKTAENLLKKHGPNEIERKKQLSPLKILLNQFKSPLIYILFFAGLITLSLKEFTDSTVIFLTVFINTILGFFQEIKAEKSLIALRKLIVPMTTVIRDKLQIQIKTSELVPGDLVVLKDGEKIPADGEIVEAIDLHINEALLTGESIPVSKTVQKEKSHAYMGTFIVSGRGKMVVEKTGMKTKMGEIAGGLSTTIEEETPLKKKIIKLSKILTYIFVAICVLILIEGLFRQKDFWEIFELAVATAVAAIPEGLVISITVILSLGMQKLLKRKSLVRKLLAAETLGGVSVICTDKTGTLTKGEMTVVKSDFTNQAIGIESTVLCNNLTNPLEISMWNWAEKQLGKKQANQLAIINQRIAEIPFSSANKFVATLYKDKLLVSGAPEILLTMSNLTSNQRQKLLEKLDEYTNAGLRVIGFTHQKNKKTAILQNLFNKLQKTDSKNKKALGEMSLDWLGFIAFEDPVRPEVKESLQACEKAGIEIKVITGDYAKTAVAVLKKLGLAKNENISVIEGHDLAKLSDKELIKQIEKTRLFARVRPEDKIRIVSALQNRGEVVAMLGDGVNDALALKKADIGVVMGEASEVSKETADIVLLDSNFKTIVAAINEGRVIFENIRGVILYLLSDSFTEVVLILASLSLGVPLPLTAVQILWINLVEDGLPGLALAFETQDENLMNQPPRKKNEPILNKEMKFLIFVIGIISDFLLLGIFLFLLNKNLDLKTIRTIIFGSLAFDSLFFVFSCKSLNKNLWHDNPFSNKFLNYSVLAGIVTLVVSINFPFFNNLLGTTPLSLGFWLLILIHGFIDLIAIETTKWFFINKKDKLNKEENHENKF